MFVLVVIASGQRILTKVRIVILSPIAAANDSSDPDSRVIHTFLGPHDSVQKRHVDRFSRFCVHSSKGSQTRRNLLTYNAFQWGEQPPNCPI